MLLLHLAKFLAHSLGIEGHKALEIDVFASWLGGGNHGVINKRVPSMLGHLDRSGLLINQAKSFFMPKTRVKSHGHTRPDTSGNIFEVT